ncbi:hypothetical protein Syun_012944 [Stephania yunnanensis]|uniref:Uncharacterized protein n=1 Tax=Stephania yunnanensis TaxID=152371 RepID=A0AAP0PI20_9MAGN
MLIIHHDHHHHDHHDDHHNIYIRWFRFDFDAINDRWINNSTGPGHPSRPARRHLRRPRPLRLSLAGSPACPPPCSQATWACRTVLPHQ